MKIVLGARKATAATSKKSGKRKIDYKDHYRRYGRSYYEKNRGKILRKAKARYKANKGKYNASHKRWLKKSHGGKVPLYMKKGGKGRRPAFPRLQPMFMRNVHKKKIGRKPRSSGPAFHKFSWSSEDKAARKTRSTRRKRAKKGWETRRSKTAG